MVGGGYSVGRRRMGGPADESSECGPILARWFGSHGILLFDDLLLVHSSWIPELGIHKFGGQLIVISPVIIWLVLFRSELRRSRWLLIAAALFAFAISLVVDRLLSPVDGASLMIEDSGKFMGILAWALYFVVTARDISRSTIAAAMEASTQSEDGSGDPAEERADDRALSGASPV